MGNLQAFMELMPIVLWARRALAASLCAGSTYAKAEFSKRTNIGSLKMPKGNPSYGKGHHAGTKEGQKKGIVQGAIGATLVIGAVRLLIQAIRGR